MRGFVTDPHVSEETSKCNFNTFLKFCDRYCSHSRRTGENCTKAKTVLFIHRYIMLLKFFNPQQLSVSPQEFFEMWVTFCGDFKVLWKKEQQLIAKQIYENTRRKLWEEKNEKIPKKRVSLSGLKLKMAFTRKGN